MTTTEWAKTAAEKIKSPDFVGNFCGSNDFDDPYYDSLCDLGGGRRLGGSGWRHGVRAQSGDYVEALRQYEHAADVIRP